MKAKLGWSFRITITTTTKLHLDWEDQGIEMAHKVAYLVKTYKILSSLIINID
jgi:hypothetical protein